MQAAFEGLVLVEKRVDVLVSGLDDCILLEGQAEDEGFELSHVVRQVVEVDWFLNGSHLQGSSAADIKMVNSGDAGS